MNHLDFEKIGLNKNEALVYIELLRLGSSTAGDIIKRTQFHRTIVYDNLDKLIDKGLVSFIQEGKKKVFQAAPPEMLSEFIEREQKELNSKKLMIDNLMKVIKSEIKDKQKQSAVMYRGIKGVKLVMKDVIETGKDYVAFGAPKISNEIMTYTYWWNFAIKQNHAGITARLLFNSSLKEWGDKIKTKEGKKAFPLTKVRFLDKEVEPLTETVVYGNKTAIIIWTNPPIITLIEDPSLAESYRAFFEILWKSAIK